MSRKTVHWRKLAPQCGYHAENIMPRRTQSIDHYTGEPQNVLCCKPMKEEKAARYSAAIGVNGDMPRGFKPL